MHKPDETLPFFTSILLSCSVAHTIAPCILRACLSVCLCLSWPKEFRTKINIIYKQEFSVSSKNTISILDPCNSTGKSLRQFTQNIGEKNRNKNKRCCKTLCIKTQRQKFAKNFEIICFLIMFAQLELFLYKLLELFKR